MSGLFGLPKRSGKLKTLNKFDATFFGVHPKQANNMDPQLRMLLEVTYEAIVDSGKYTHYYLILKQHLSKREEIIAIWFIFIYKVNLIEQNLKV